MHEQLKYMKKIKEKEKMSDDYKTLNEIKNIGKKMKDCNYTIFYPVKFGRSNK